MNTLPFVRSFAPPALVATFCAAGIACGASGATTEGGPKADPGPAGSASTSPAPSSSSPDPSPSASTKPDAGDPPAASRAKCGAAPYDWV
ncbi:MAG: hypothetical protein K0S65_608, partial [Labilithrix sp.]|nr:hypothetical protein [Labilithrix sp.]